MQLWIVGKWSKDVWEFAGVFDDEQRAVAACRTKNYFVAPATLNETMPAKRTDWPGCYYPNEKGATD